MSMENSAEQGGGRRNPWGAVKIFDFGHRTHTTETDSEDDNAVMRNFTRQMLKDFIRE